MYRIKREARFKTARAYLASSFPKSLLRTSHLVEKNLKAGLDNLGLNLQDGREIKVQDLENTHKLRRATTSQTTKPPPSLYGECSL